MKRLFPLLFVCSLWVSSTNAQTKSSLKFQVLEEATPESVGISSERLARIDKMCKEEVVNGNSDNWFFKPSTINDQVEKRL